MPDQAWPSASRYFVTEADFVDFVEFSVFDLAAFAETLFLATDGDLVPTPPTVSDSRD